ncbi:MAG: rubrerythrin family protein [Bacillota bacterium]|nr:rubrerythrin family protein [Bacillota bacterium]
MKELRGTKTASNLITAFAGESQAYQRYVISQKIADQAGYKSIARVFAETADNERVHAKTLYKYLKDEFQNEAVELNPEYTAFPVVYKDTKLALRGAIDGENEEATSMYPEFSKIAEEEGFPKIAKSFKEIGEVEEHHRERFQILLDTLEAGQMFKKDHSIVWKCLNCGYIHEGEEAPLACPACDHPQGYFEAVGLVK